MTRTRTYWLTAGAALFVGLCRVFADGLFGGPFWNGEDIFASSVFT